MKGSQHAFMVSLSFFSQAISDETRPLQNNELNNTAGIQFARVPLKKALSFYKAPFSKAKSSKNHLQTKCKHLNKG